MKEMKCTAHKQVGNDLESSHSSSLGFTIKALC